MLRRDFVRVAVALGLAPKWLLSQQATGAPPPPAPVPWTLGLNPTTPLPHTRVADGIAQDRRAFFQRGADGYAGAAERRLVASDG